MRPLGALENIFLDNPSHTDAQTHRHTPITNSLGHMGRPPYPPFVHDAQRQDVEALSQDRPRLDFAMTGCIKRLPGAVIGIV